MKFISICSGIEAASVAFGPLGWEAIAFSEIEPFPSAALFHHYPHVPNFGDMSKYAQWPDETFLEADAIVGGPPCQAFSVAGLRDGLNDTRGNLTITYAQLINHADRVRIRNGKPPVVFLYENVPGLLSDKTNALGCLLGALAGKDGAAEPPRGKWTDAGAVFGPQRTIAWRTLDAQYFGLAQRRRRVFLVGSAREGFDPAAVLFEFDGVRRDSAPSREAGKVAPTIPSRSTAGGGLGTDFDCDGGVVQVCPTLRAGGNRTGGDRPPGTDVDTAESLQVVTHTLDQAQGQAVVQPVFEMHGQDSRVRDVGDVCPTVTSKYGTGGGNVPVTLQPVTYDLFNVTAPVNRQSRQPGDPCHTLARSNAEHAVVVGTDCYNGTITGDVAATMGTPGSSVNASGPTVMQAVAFAPAEVGPTMGSSGPPYSRTGNERVETDALAIHAMQVRRLTPVECERLQGFPDGYTNIPWRGKPESPDGPRYKALGNSWAVPVVRWIGIRIEMGLTGLL